MPAEDFNGLIAWLKSNPDKASFGTTTAGLTEIAGVLFQKRTGTRFGFVPYRGGAPTLQDVVAGQIDLAMLDPTTSLAQVRAGNVKAFAVAAAARLSSAPEIPMVDEAGLPDFTYRSGMAFGCRSGHRRPLSRNSTPQWSKPWPIRGCALGSRTSAKKFLRATSRRQRRSPPCRRPRSRNGGRSSRSLG